MLQKFKVSILSFLALFMISVPLIATGGVAVAVDTNSCLAQGSNLNVAAANCADNETNTSGDSLTDFISKALNILSIIVGVVAVVMIIVGGFRYTASGGKEEGIKGAKNSILYALIGLIIVALAQIIVRFVLDKTVQ